MCSVPKILHERWRRYMARKAVDKAPKTEEPKVKKRPSRKPLTAEAKAAAAEVRAKIKEKAARLKPALILQYQGSEVDMDTLVEAAKSDFRSVKKRTPITALTLYVKPEERMAYYVINEEHEGKISY